MFMHSDAKCAACQKMFCCRSHRHEHQKSGKCQPLALPSTPRINATRMQLIKSKLHSPIRNMIISHKPSLASCEKKSPRRTSKRAHHLTNIFRSPINVKKLTSTSEAVAERRVIKVARRRFRKVQRVPALPAVTEEIDDHTTQPRSKTVRWANPTQPLNIPVAHKNGIYRNNNFEIFNPTESPIVPNGSTIPTPLQEPVFNRNSNVCITPNVKTVLFVEPNDYSSTTSTLLEHHSKNVLYPSQSKIDDNICDTPKCIGDFMTSTPKDMEMTYVEPIINKNLCPALDKMGNTTIAGFLSPRPVVSTPPEQDNTKQSVLTLASDTSSNNERYYTARCSFSPFEQPNSSTPGLSVVSSMKNTLCNMFQHLAGTAQEMTPDSPLRKRYKMSDLSKIKCRPTYKGRYKQPVTYVINND